MEAAAATNLQLASVPTDPQMQDSAAEEKGWLLEKKIIQWYLLKHSKNNLAGPLLEMHSTMESTYGHRRRFKSLNKIGSNRESLPL